MAEEQTGQERSEQPTAKRLTDFVKRRGRPPTRLVRPLVLGRPSVSHASWL